MDSLYIVMPAYNEEDNITEVVKKWYPLLEGKDEKSRLVISDTGSSDSTHEILVGMKQSSYPKLEILENDNKLHGPKLIALYDCAVKNGIDFIFQTDSDDQTNPEEFSAFWDLRDKYDGIFGNRVRRGDGKNRALVEKVVCILLKLYFGVKIPDANAPFRLMRTDIVKKYLYRMSTDYNLPNIMLTTYFAYYHEKTKFVEITFKPRVAGKNSINIPKIIRIGFKALGDFRAYKKNMMCEE